MGHASQEGWITELGYCHYRCNVFLSAVETIWPQVMGKFRGILLVAKQPHTLSVYSPSGYQCKAQGL